MRASPAKRLKVEEWEDRWYVREEGGIPLPLNSHAAGERLIEALEENYRLKEMLWQMVLLLNPFEGMDHLYDRMREVALQWRREELAATAKAELGLPPAETLSE